ncbi:MAG: tagaturonate reductase [Lachnospiraceae bacterium]
MNKLSYATLEEMKYDGFLQKEGKTKVLQFGEGNFLRAFVDYFFDILNEKCDFNGKITLVQPIANGLTDMINNQDGLYTLYLRGREKGQQVNQKRIISSVSNCINPYADFAGFLNYADEDDLRFIVSNTTEAGITFDDTCKFDDAPQTSFPGKLTRFMYERFTKGKKGFVILSCELIDNNGKELQKCVEQYADLWNLGEDFKAFVQNDNIFCSTLVDRIVTGYPRTEADAINAENGYLDNIIDTGEIFGFWVIEGPASLKEELPFEKAGLPVLIADDHTPYKKRKVRILNGAHTSMIMAAYLAGQDIVRFAMDDKVIVDFMNNTLNDEIIPTLDLPKDELMEFAASVIDRFNNPYIDHELLAISLNSTSKWLARVYPSFTEYVKRFGTLPKHITFSFAAYIAFYRATEMRDGALIGHRNDNEYKIMDDAFILDFYKNHSELPNAELVTAVCKNEKFWGVDLTTHEGFAEAVIAYLDDIDTNGMYQAMQNL